MSEELEEGCICPECKEGKFYYKSIHEGGCSCHINPPCSYCTDQVLECDNCGFRVDLQQKEIANIVSHIDDIYPFYVFKPFKIKGATVTKMDHSHCKIRSKFSCEYKGELTKRDIIEHFGSGTFGHRFDRFDASGFIYVKHND